MSNDPASYRVPVLRLKDVAAGTTGQADQATKNQHAPFPNTPGPFARDDEPEASSPFGESPASSVPWGQQPAPVFTDQPGSGPFTQPPIGTNPAPPQQGWGGAPPQGYSTVQQPYPQGGYPPQQQQQGAPYGNMPPQQIPYAPWGQAPQSAAAQQNAYPPYAPPVPPPQQYPDQYPPSPAPVPTTAPAAPQMPPRPAAPTGWVDTEPVPSPEDVASLQNPPHEAAGSTTADSETMLRSVDDDPDSVPDIWESPRPAPATPAQPRPVQPIRPLPVPPAVEQQWRQQPPQAPRARAQEPPVDLGSMLDSLGPDVSTNTPVQRPLTPALMVDADVDPDTVAHWPDMSEEAPDDQAPAQFSAVAVSPANLSAPVDHSRRDVPDVWETGTVAQRTVARDPASMDTDTRDLGVDAAEQGSRAEQPLILRSRDNHEELSSAETDREPTDPQAGDASAAPGSSYHVPITQLNPAPAEPAAETETASDSWNEALERTLDGSRDEPAANTPTPFAPPQDDRAVPEVRTTDTSEPSVFAPDTDTPETALDVHTSAVPEVDTPQIVVPGAMETVVEGKIETLVDARNKPAVPDMWDGAAPAGSGTVPQKPASTTPADAPHAVNGSDLAALRERILRDSVQADHTEPPPVAPSIPDVTTAATQRKVDLAHTDLQALQAASVSVVDEQASSETPDAEPTEDTAATSSTPETEHAHAIADVAHTLEALQQQPTDATPHEAADTKTAGDTNAAPKAPPTAPTGMQGSAAVPLIRTFKRDVQSAVRQGRTSPVDMIAAQERARALGDVVVRQAKETWFKPSTYVFLGTGIVLVFGAAVIGVLYFWPGHNNSQVTSYSLFNTENTILYDATDKTRPDLMRDLVHLRDDTALNAGDIAQVNVTERVTLPASGEEEVTPESASEFLTQLGAHLPTNLSRSLSDPFVLGFHRVDDTNAPFLVLRTNYVDNAISGMVEWEQTLATDLGPLFDQMQDAPQQTPPAAPVVTTATADAASSTASSTTPTATTTMTTMTTTATTQRQSTKFHFNDVTRDGVQLRVLRDTNGNDVLVWSIPDSSSVIISTNEDTITELRKRMATRSL